jgi:hypothetical protein
MKRYGLFDEHDRLKQMREIGDPPPKNPPKKPNPL